MPGGPRDLAALGPADARRLGAALREVHDTRSSAVGGLWWWRVPARDLTTYREGRVRDAEAALAGTRDAGLPHRFAAEPAPPGDASGLLHGDLVAANAPWLLGGDWS